MKKGRSFERPNKMERDSSGDLKIESRRGCEAMQVEIARLGACKFSVHIDQIPDHVLTPKYVEIIGSGQIEMIVPQTEIGAPAKPKAQFGVRPKCIVFSQEGAGQVGKIWSAPYRRISDSMNDFRIPSEKEASARIADQAKSIPEMPVSIQPGSRADSPRMGIIFGMNGRGAYSNTRSANLQQGEIDLLHDPACAGSKEGLDDEARA